MSKTNTKLKLPMVSHNCFGQRLGRKGLETRERILQATLDLLDRTSDAPITLSSVALRASVGMTTLYLYFPDLGELVLAALQRIMSTSGEAFLDRIRTRWPDDRVEEACLDFLRAHFRFWQEHTRILHLRNSMADAGDERFIEYRNQTSLPLIAHLVDQLDSDAGTADSWPYHLATVMLTGFERLATVVTAGHYRKAAGYEKFENGEDGFDRLLRAEARIMSLAVSDQRAAANRTRLA